LFVAGSDSPFWPKEHGVASAALCPQGEAAVIEGSGHAVNWECPQEFDRIMLDFLKKITD
jgi:pimeloyl-ACP methyl ester carboxylesterase